MNSKLYCILYHSRLAPDAPLSCISDIIKTARSFNSAHGLTGVLVFDGQHFLQYLEGPQMVVQDLLVSIARDPRHMNLTLQHQGPCPGERLFRNWSMGYALVDDADPLADLGEVVGEEALAQLHALVPTLDIA
ncbi:BLUF domain-containing protein [Comamonas endophytica]|uniref:BLUF domain-containing protein n=1 Tax=Comamonas endophytica TaxID=2949090 RepID=A0ABY6GG82_9BURK|nr:MULTISPECIES: BLUF domain-containing protein [unclassified Acidovorax]MCD2513300.1 BLUF domain-containing protein [Acidovorax sp. D4N7]UYG53913.1 BLUF domain-containing protein [Acidovorax sp. 5MLIR]